LVISVAVTLALLVFVALKLRDRFRHLDRQFSQVGPTVDRLLKDRVIAKIEEAAQEVQNAAALQHMGFRSPLFLGGWSIDSFLGKRLVHELGEERPQCIVELGSGSSTLLMAHYLRMLGQDDHEHIAVDHDERYLSLTRNTLRLNSLDTAVQFWLCPLAAMEPDATIWYSGLIERLQDRKIDLLLIDGPPGVLQRKARFPAMPLLMPYLSQRALIILDDAGREEEKAIAEEWHSAYPDFSLEFLNEGHGVALLRRRRT
jgi:predicted O-methyltransferase YrrM